MGLEILYEGQSHYSREQEGFGHCAGRQDGR